MSSFRGRVDEPWPLSRAVDALADAARAAGRPGWIWLAGVFYPALSLFPGVGWLGGALSGATSDTIRLTWDGPGALPVVTGFPPTWAGLGGVCLSLPALPLLLVFARLIVGLARTAAPREWARAAPAGGSPRLGAVWRAGEGLSIATAGMWVLLASMLIGASLLLVVPASELTRWAIDFVGVPRTLAISVLLAPAVLLLAAYATTVSVIQQLALQSLVHNRRGVGSALVHAWNLARRDPWATVRSLSVDVVGVLVVGAVAFAIDHLCEALDAATLGRFLSACLAGFVGVTRAGYWARSYAGLGGLTPEDGVPGLGEAADPRASEQRRDSSDPVRDGRSERR
ncbi:MAG: hypothetical protein QF903_03230 [Planctomycetota bacterium]|jgi:hypothetical protein|nr:hypothetical protein [Planctomycetota bacterium]MDP6762622.1 hypothetical protein [Planctomycetota bacterium]MDP6988469.1 hypothetical protein [Planctomycetota bacterium]